MTPETLSYHILATRALRLLFGGHVWCAKRPGVPDLLIRSLKLSLPILPTWRWRCGTGSHPQPHSSSLAEPCVTQRPTQVPSTCYSLANPYQEDRFHLQGQRRLGSFFFPKCTLHGRSLCSRADHWMGLFLHLAGKTQLFPHQRFSFLSLSEQARMVWTQ